jgi:membrane carboxypeptidase/penicillin-binding protein PbpC
VTHTHDDALEKLKCELEKFKRAAFEAQIEIKESVTETIETMEDNLQEQIESWTQNVKNSLMTQDMQDAVVTIQFVLGRLSIITTLPLLPFTACR